ncbi:MAG: response regulator [Bacteriovorax sp.]|jgi:DNA-binding response OmpR family regulator|nr:response regulator [Bacteriovorax sp.]
MKPLNIVYLDDEPLLCEFFKDCLESEDIVIKTFISPDEAIKEVMTNTPDLVFLDFRLPNTTGDIVAQKMDAKIPKVLITGDLVVEPESTFIKIFKKPFNFSEMKEFIDHFQNGK